MSTQSKISFIIGVFAFMATCSGQQPSDKKPLKHFASDIMKVDSILSAALHFNKQKISNYRLPFDHGSDISFELIRDRDDWKECSVCPLISEIIWPNEKDK